MTDKLKQLWEFIKEYKQGIFIGLLIFSYVLLNAIADIRLNQRVKALEAKAASIESRLTATGATVEKCKETTDNLIEQVQTVQTQNDKSIEVNANNAYTKIKETDDGSVADMWNSFLADVEKRNSSRDNNSTAEGDNGR